MTEDSFRSLVRGFAVVSFLIGGLGCILCVPYACSTSAYWISTAGLYFVAGGIMITGSLIALSVLGTKAPEKSA